MAKKSKAKQGWDDARKLAAAPAEALVSLTELLRGKKFLADNDGDIEKAQNVLSIAQQLIASPQ